MNSHLFKKMNVLKNKNALKSESKINLKFSMKLMTDFNKVYLEIK